jgi:hypothetical protein
LKTLSEVLFSRRVKNTTTEADLFRQAVISGDSHTLEDLVNAYFGRVVHVHHRDDESFYHCMFWSYCHNLFETAEMEAPGSYGNLDVSFELGENIYAIVELKYAHPDSDEINILETNIGGSKTTENEKDASKLVNVTNDPKKTKALFKKLKTKIDKKLNKLADDALKSIEECKYGLKYRIPGNTVIDIGMGIYWRGQVKVAFRISSFTLE